MDEMAIDNAKTHAIIREVLSLCEEVRNNASKTILYTPSLPKPNGSSQLEIESGGSTMNGEKWSNGKILDLSHKNIMVTTGIRNEGNRVLGQVFDVNSNNIRVIASLDDKGGEEKEKKELIGREGTTKDISRSGGFVSERIHSADGTCSVFLNFGPEPDPEPPDGDSPLPQIQSLGDSVGSSKI